MYNAYNKLVGLSPVVNEDFIEPLRQYALSLDIINKNRVKGGHIKNKNRKRKYEALINNLKKANEKKLLKDYNS